MGRLSPLLSGLIHDHPGHRLSVFLLLWRIDAMSFGVYRKTVYCMLNFKILEFAVVLRVILVKNRNGTAVTGGVNAAEARIELDHVRTICHREIRDGFVFIEIEYGHKIILFA